MIHCTRCSYAWNPDSAKNCVQCKAPLDADQAARRGDTLNENHAPSNVRRQTVAEGVLPPGNAIKLPEEKQPGLQSYDSVQRRRTVFAGAPQKDERNESTVQPTSPDPVPRQQTVAVDPGRKIVGILVTYSWQEQGQIFPIFEGRNLIGKDPNQCDICIPQDATLSAVNTFITHRRQFIIGDRVSMSGTDVNGEPIESEFVPLENYAKIRTGSTHWTFLAIQPPAQ